MPTALVCIHNLQIARQSIAEYKAYNKGIEQAREILGYGETHHTHRQDTSEN